jgi:hypothetical protein
MGVLIAAATFLPWYESSFVPFESGNAWDSVTLVTATFWNPGFIVAGGGLLALTGVLLWRRARREPSGAGPGFGLISVFGLAAGVLIVPVALHDFAALLAGHADAYGIDVTLVLGVIAAVAIVVAVPAGRLPAPSARGPALIGAITAIAGGAVVMVSSWLPWSGVDFGSIHTKASLWQLHTTTTGYNGANRQSLAPFIVRAFRETDDIIFEGPVLVAGGVLLIVGGFLVLAAHSRRAWSPRLVACILELWVLAAYFTVAVTANNRKAIGPSNLRTGANLALAASIAGLLGLLLALLPLSSSAHGATAQASVQVSVPR